MGDGNDGDQLLVFRGLRASTVHKDITIRAIGESGMASAVVRVPDFSTLRELHPRRASTDLYILHACGKREFSTNFDDARAFSWDP